MKKKYLIASILFCLMCFSGNILAKSGYYKYQPINDEKLLPSEECYTQKDDNKKDRAFCRVDGAEKAVKYYMNISENEYQQLKGNLHNEERKIIIVVAFIVGSAVGCLRAMMRHSL